MDSVVKLTNWFIACHGGSTSRYYLTLRDYFNLEDEEMEDIVGPNSMIAMISRQINSTISTDPVLDLNLTNGLNDTELAQI